MFHISPSGWSERNNKGNIAVLGERLKMYRLRQNYTQKQVAEHAGVSIKTLQSFESGNSISLDNLMSIMRTLDLISNFNELITERRISPIELAKYLKKTKKERAHQKK